MTTISSSHRLIVSASDRAGLARLRESLGHLKGVRITHDLPLIDSVAVELDATLTRQEWTPRLEALVPGRLHVADDAGVHATETSGATAEKSLVEDQRKFLGVDRLHRARILGKGVTVAVIDSGVAPHADMGNRLVAFTDLVNGRTAPYDDHGHGTHAATSIAGNGLKSDRYYLGCAPEAGIAAVKVLDQNLEGSTSGIIAGIQWAVENKERYNIRVINLSLGHPVQESHRTDPMCRAVAAATAAGILVCVAAGNSGPEPGTVLAPANTPEALAVGAFHDNASASPSDFQMAMFSSRGPTAVDGEAKPDVIAPGVAIVAGDRRDDYTGLSGTSAAAPIVSGVAALLLSAHPNLAPAQVKALLMRTATPLPRVDAGAQGKGVIDGWKAHQGA